MSGIDERKFFVQKTYFFQLFAICMFFLWDLRGPYKQPFLRKTIFLMTKERGLFFLVISSMKKLRKQLRRIQKFSLQLVWKSCDYFPVPKRFLKTQSFVNKNVFPKIKILRPFFLVFLSMTNLKE